MEANHATHYKSLMDIGQMLVQSEENAAAAAAFEQASLAAESNEQRSKAYQMAGVAYRKLLDYAKATFAFMEALRFAESVIQRGKVLRDLGELQSENRDFNAADASLRDSYRILLDEEDAVEAAATYGFIGRNAARQGDAAAARTYMRSASRRLSPNPVYKLNNTIHWMLVSPLERWFLLPMALWLVISCKKNRTVGALGRVGVALGGPALYEKVRRRQQ